jgi:hypothetical protein
MKRIEKTIHDLKDRGATSHANKKGYNRNDIILCSQRFGSCRLLVLATPGAYNSGHTARLSLALRMSTATVKCDFRRDQTLYLNLGGRGFRGEEAPRWGET